MRGVLGAALLAALLGGCCHRPMVRPYPPPAPEEILARVAAARAAAPGLNAETRTDVRLAKDRLNLTVHMLAAWGGRLRFLALGPDGSAAAELAADGQRYCFLDVYNNCGGCGPVSPEGVGQLLGLALPPDDIVALVLGGAPLLPDAAATLRWDADAGAEVLTLTAAGARQVLVVDGRGKTWDVLDSQVFDEAGRLLYRVRHKDFHPVKGADGALHRLPGRSLIEQGKESVRIIWRDQAVGPAASDDKFRLAVPAGLPLCGNAP